MSSKKPSQLSDLDSQIKYDQQIVTLKSELQSVRQKYSNLLKKKALEDQILEQNQELIEAFPKVNIISKVNKSDIKKETLVIVLSCLHIGEVVKLEQTQGLNEYNLKVICQRLQYIADTIIDFTIHNQKNISYTDLHVIFTGDIVSGEALHEELARTNELNITEQATIGALICAQFIQDLSKHFQTVKVLSIIGNHGRVSKEKYFKDKATNSWDYITACNMALLLADQPNVSFQLPRSYWALINIRKSKFMVIHGDTTHGSSNPLVGLAKSSDKMKNILSANNESFQYLISSHYHNKGTQQTTVGENICSASLKGTDEYCLALGYHSDPVITTFSVDDKGKTWQLDINTKFAPKVTTRYKYDLTKSLTDQLHILKK